MNLNLPAVSALKKYTEPILLALIKYISSLGPQLYSISPLHLFPRLKSGLHFKLAIRPLRLRSSFTVEAAMLMTILLPAILAILYLGFYLHDNGVMTGACEEIAARADLNTWKGSANNKLSSKAKKLRKKLATSKKVTSSVSVTKNQVSVSYNGSIKLPPFLETLFGKTSLSTSASAKRGLLHPADTIRKIRGLEYLSDILKGDK